MDDFEYLMNELRKFRNDRLWESFHTTKDLAVAISVEAAELNELMLWKSPVECEKINEDRLREELADVLIFSLLLADKHKLNVKEIVLDKIRINGLKYPVEKSKGSLKKYTEL